MEGLSPRSWRGSWHSVRGGAYCGWGAAIAIGLDKPEIAVDLPIVRVLADRALAVVTGLARAADLAGGWRGLLDSAYGRVLDVKVLLFLGLVALGALNRYRVVPALAATRRPPGEPEGDAGGGAEGLGALRRNVRAEVALAACVLAAAAVLTALAGCGKDVPARSSIRARRRCGRSPGTPPCSVPSGTRSTSGWSSPEGSGEFQSARLSWPARTSPLTSASRASRNTSSQACTAAS